MNVLGIETSCDETSAAVVVDGTKILSNVVSSQVKLHAPYGGVVPEIASRNHVVVLPEVIQESIDQSGLSWNEVDVVAATYGPGLASSLLVGLSAGKGLAIRLQKPFVGINHLEAHVYSAFLGEDVPSLESFCPLIALVVSGGHTCVLRVRQLGDYELLGQTLDDAAGEAFDKGASLLGLGYPGGPIIDKISKHGQPKFVQFPRGHAKKGSKVLGGLRPELCFSYSGLKTALMYYLRENPAENDEERSSVAASFQEAVVDTLIERLDLALGGEGCLVVGGGVSLNSRLREQLQSLASRRGIRLMLAKPAHCGDNAAMIAGLAGAGGGVIGEAAMKLDAEPNLGIGTCDEFESLKSSGA